MELCLSGDHHHHPPHTHLRTIQVTSIFGRVICIPFVILAMCCQWCVQPASSTTEFHRHKIENCKLPASIAQHSTSLIKCIKSSIINQNIVSGRELMEAASNLQGMKKRQNRPSALSALHSLHPHKLTTTADKGKGAAKNTQGAKCSQ